MCQNPWSELRVMTCLQRKKSFKQIPTPPSKEIQYSIIWKVIPFNGRFPFIVCFLTVRCCLRLYSKIVDIMLHVVTELLRNFLDNYILKAFN